jgi:hypothetical protein
MATVLMSTKQLGYIRVLANKGGFNFDELLMGVASMVQASALIEQLKARTAQIAAPAATPELVAEGIYRRSSDASMFRVQTAQDSGRRYAKTLLAAGGWDYERGAIYTLAASERLTLAQIQAWGLDTGVCAVCSRLLSTADSVAAGIGPVCARRYS